MWALFMCIHAPSCLYFIIIGYSSSKYSPNRLFHDSSELCAGECLCVCWRGDRPACVPSGEHHTGSWPGCGHQQGEEDHQGTKEARDRAGGNAQTVNLILVAPMHLGL